MRERGIILLTINFIYDGMLEIMTNITAFANPLNNNLGMATIFSRSSSFVINQQFFQQSKQIF